MKDILIEFLLVLNEKGLINNYDFDYEKVSHDFANKKKFKMALNTKYMFNKNRIELIVKEWVKLKTGIELSNDTLSQMVDDIMGDKDKRIKELEEEA